MLPDSTRDILERWIGIPRVPSSGWGSLTTSRPEGVADMLIVIAFDGCVGSVGLRLLRDQAAKIQNAFVGGSLN